MNDSAKPMTGQTVAQIERELEEFCLWLKEIFRATYEPVGDDWPEGWDGRDKAAFDRALLAARPEPQAPVQTGERELPPLPAPRRHGGTYESSPFEYFTEHDMREYARAAITSVTKETKNG